MATIKKKNVKNKRKRKTSQSFDALNKAFGKTPKWRKKEIAAKKRKEKKRAELVNSVKMLGDDDEEFNEDAFASLFDDNGDNKSMKESNDVEMDDKSKKKHKRKRLSSKKRKALYKEMQENPAKRRKLNGEGEEKEDGFKDEDFEDGGIILTTVHAKKSQKSEVKDNENTNSNTNSTKKTKKEKNKMIEKKRGILSQINRFELS